MFKIAWRNLRRNWRHSLASMLSIAAGFMAVCLFEGFIGEMAWHFEDGFTHRGMLGHLTVSKEGAAQYALENPWKYVITREDQAVIDAFLETEADRLEARQRFLNFIAMVSNGSTTTVAVGYGYDVAQGVRMRGPMWEWNTIGGRPLRDGQGDQVVVGRRLGLLMDCDAPLDLSLFLPDGGYRPVERPIHCTRETVQLQATTERGPVNAVEASIVGIVDAGLREFDDKFVSMPLDTAQRMLDTEGLSMYTLLLKDPAETEAFGARLEATARARGVAIEVTPWQKHPMYGELYRRAMELFRIFRTFVMAVVILVGSLSVANTLTRSVAERTREIGTLRSIGYLRRHIVVMFVWEGILLGLAGSAIGLALSLGVTGAMNAAHIMYMPGFSTAPAPLGIRAAPEAWVLTTLGLCAISAVAALIPARRAARMRISDALGHV